MHPREINSSRIRGRSPTPGSSKRMVKLFFCLIILAVIFIAVSSFGHLHASSRGTLVKSGYDGYCLDNYHDQNITGNQVDIWSCDGGASQDWDVSLTSIAKPGNLCLSANSVTSISLENCNQSGKQVWLEDDNQLYNPHFGLCLTANSSGNGQVLVLESCGLTDKASQEFNPSIDLSDVPCSGSQGQKVACTAVKEWILWQAHPNDRINYLTTITGGAPYEEWCADFVSYIYQQAGYPFSNGNYDNWDENIAGDIVNQGFTVDQSSSYVPQPGDVAYFDYPGGHVEIVIVGGKNPTFIYGDSDTIDPYINNGAMGANDITNQPGLGSVQYYMSPNSST